MYAKGLLRLYRKILLRKSFDVLKIVSYFIGSNSIIQKIDLANAYINMGKTNLAKKILRRLENAPLTKYEKKELNKLKKHINND